MPLAFSSDTAADSINRAADSNPASVKESAAAEQQHHEDDDEQSGRVHFLSRVFGERRPASSRPLNARDERRLFRRPRGQGRANSSL